MQYDATGGGGSGAGVKAIQIGQNLVGKTKYVWGGGRDQGSINRGHFDCSGFVQYAFKQAGVNVGNGNTDTLVKQGVAVDPSQMRPGDVVFFDTYKKNGHVGIYMGNGKFIGSQSSTGVAVADMSKGYFKQHFSGVVRRIGGGAAVGGQAPRQMQSFSGGGVQTGGSKPWITQQAGKFMPMFQQSASRYGVDPSILAAMSMQESSMGKSTGYNIMEANGGVAGGGQFRSYQDSINAGTQEFAARYKEANGDVRKALAAYNMGAGILKWFDKYSGGQYSKDVMKQYSSYYAKRYGWRRYGDVNYVDNVLRYYR